MKDAFSPEQEERIKALIDEALQARDAAIALQVRRQLAGYLLGRDPDVFDLPDTRVARRLYWFGRSPAEIRAALKSAEGGADV